MLLCVNDMGVSYGDFWTMQPQHIWDLLLDRKYKNQKAANPASVLDFDFDYHLAQLD